MSGLDPARGMIVHGLSISGEAAAQALSAIEGLFRLDDVRGRLSRHLHETGFDFGIQHKGSVLDRAADRILQRAKAAGLCEHVGGGAWRATCDSGRHPVGEACQSGDAQTPHRPKGDA